MAESGLIKPRIRYSGAARRRYKKMKERGELFENIQNPPSAIVLRSVDKEDARINVQKRVMPEQSPSSSPNSHLNKRPKTSDEGPTHAQAMDKEDARINVQKHVMPEQSPSSSPNSHLNKRPKTTDEGSTHIQAMEKLKIAFVPEDYPNKKLSADEVGVVRKLIRERILQLPEDALVPTFIGTWERDGAVIFNCANEASMDWLKSLSTEIKVEDTPLYVLSADELPKRHWIVVYAESDLTVVEITKLLDKQNVGLLAREWMIIGPMKESENKNVKTTHFATTHFAALINDLSLEGLKACDFKPFCGLSRANVKLFDKERREGTGETTHRDCLKTETV